MQAFVDWILAYWEQLIVIPPSVIAVGAWVAMRRRAKKLERERFAQLLREELERLPSVKRIRSAEDIDLVGLCEFQDDRFRGRSHVVPDMQEYQKWLDDVKDMAGEVEDVLLIIKRGNSVSGMLYATFYFKYKIIFVSALAVEPRSVDLSIRHDGTTALFTRLYEECLDHYWDAIVAEVEPEIEGDPEHGPNTTSVFQHAAMVVSRNLALDIAVFEISIDYYQPLLNTRVDPSMTSTYGNPKYLQTLLYAPRDASKLNDAESGHRIEKQKAVRVLTYIFRTVYGDAQRGTDDFDIYEKYIENELHEHIRRLPDVVALRPRWRR